ncbi:MAG: glycosyltransferase [Bryobacteraceae bacterium]
MSRVSWRLSLIVPCFNEASRLNEDLFRRFLANSTATRLVFVDDGSADNTLDLLARVCSGYEDHATVVRCDRNGGKAAAVRIGINYALENFHQEIIGYWDADLATPLECVDNFVKVLDEQPQIEMVFGSRVKLLGRHVERRAARHYLGRIFATVVSIMLHLPIYDTQCGAKLFRVRDQTGRIFAEPFLSKWVFDVEIIARYLNASGNETRRLERMIYEYPLETWVDVEGSKVRPLDFLTALVDLIRIQSRYLSKTKPPSGSASNF